MRKIVEVAHIVAFELEANTVLAPKPEQNLLDVSECVLENEITRVLEIRFLPIMFP